MPFGEYNAGHKKARRWEGVGYFVGVSGDAAHPLHQVQRQAFGSHDGKRTTTDAAKIRTSRHSIPI